MSDSKKNPKIPPPDDFSKTTPNVNIQSDDFDDSSADWEKTQYGSVSDAPADDWGKTVINYDVSSLDTDNDIGKKLHPSNDDPSKADWGVTQPNINLNDDFEASGDQDESMDGATVPYFKLPEADREKYQNVPPTPTERAKKAEEEKKKAGGIPTWFWVSAALMSMFSFSVLVLLGVWFFFTGTSSFMIIVKGAKPSSHFLVDETRWGVTNADGKIYLTNLKPGKRKLIIRNKGFEDDEREVTGNRGDEIEIFAKQQESANECQTIDLTNVKQREDCANIILNNLDRPPNLDDLLKALNLYYINFASGQHAIPPSRQKFLGRAASYMKELPDNVVIEIGGHTDNRGSKSDNQALSERRANSVKAFFLGKLIKPALLTTKGYGAEKKKASNENEAGRFQNRRIEYTVNKQEK